MLEKVGEFIEPLTRFDKSRLGLSAYADDVIALSADQRFRADRSSTVHGYGAEREIFDCRSIGGAIGRVSAGL